MQPRQRHKYSKGENDMQETQKTILQDTTKNGKERNWRALKIGSRYLSAAYQRLGMESKAARVLQCASFLEFKPVGERMKLQRANFCRVQLCPMCTMRRTVKIFGQVSKVMNYIQERENYRYIFLTLTVRNVSGEELPNAMDEIFKGFHALIHHVKFKALSKGWFRAMEVTHNWQRDDYHPHLHVIIAVDERYFTHYENYLKHEEWREEWKKCMSLDYEPFVHVCRVRKDSEAAEDGTIQYRKAVAESAKYTVKSTDYLVMWRSRDRFERKTGMEIKSREQCYELTDNVVAIMDSALHKRRLVAYGGHLRDVHKLLNLDDPVDGDLINTDNNDIREDLDGVTLCYRWNIGVGNYVLFKNDKKRTGSRT